MFSQRFGKEIFCYRLTKHLVKDLEKRYSATDCISHKWIVEKADEGLTTGTIGGGVTS